MTTSDSKQTNFGFRQVQETDKADLVGDVFDSVADNYDLMNDLMSLASIDCGRRLQLKLLV